MSHGSKRRKTSRQPVTDALQQKLLSIASSVSSINVHGQNVTTYMPTLSLKHINTLLTPLKEYTQTPPLCCNASKCFAIESGLSTEPFGVWMSELELANLIEFKIVPQERRCCVMCEAKRVHVAYTQSLLSEAISEVSMQRFAINTAEFRHTIPYKTHMYSNTTCLASHMFVPSKNMCVRTKTRIIIDPFRANGTHPDKPL